ncbi:agmatine deiminase family protein [Prevotella sp. E13-17]|uniref:agmatine deiminase family protein n=1 Tax=Prevotella sp. E13-17 TaxID=2913616 RepID=UPI001EDB5E6E|nr:agmatine deiminase family protein [Prevotella sp. E13-17]UKK51832.1 agmatine deiminase family protein [Prevotella sp. E13-17]
MKTNKRRMLAEWEAQSMVQLTWPHKDTDWAPILPEITAVYRNLAREIGKREALLIVAPEELSAELGNLENASITSFTSNDTWARDHGFITVEEDQQLVLLDFQFNGWGEKFEAELDNQINRYLYDQGLVNGDYEQHLDFVLEGGSIESDGQGTVFTTSCCLMAPHRNQPLTQLEIEERLKAWLGAERIVWLNHGSLIGDDTDGHIDTLVRICPNDTIVYTGGDEAHPDLALMEEELRGLRTTDGKPYRLLKLPLPRPIYDDGDRLPATYANYLIVNGAVLMPTYNQPDLDAEAMRVVGEAFPDREIVGIDCRAVVKQHGSLHCCTMQYY